MEDSQLDVAASATREALRRRGIEVEVLPNSRSRPAVRRMRTGANGRRPPPHVLRDIAPRPQPTEPYVTVRK